MKRRSVPTGAASAVQSSQHPVVYACARGRCLYGSAGVHLLLWSPLVGKTGSFLVGVPALLRPLLGVQQRCLELNCPIPPACLHQRCLAKCCGSPQWPPAGVAAFWCRSRCHSKFVGEGHWLPDTTVQVTGMAQPSTLCLWALSAHVLLLVLVAR